MNSAGTIVSIGMGEMKVTNDPSVSLCCVGLGSCIGFCVYDPIARIGGMAHMVLPQQAHKNGGIPTAKYVNTGIPLVLEEMQKAGAMQSRLIVKMAGGAQMFSIPGANMALDVGTRNIEMAHQLLANMGIRQMRSDLGGSKGRTMYLIVETGKVFVRTVGQNNIEL
jgi:chemotaxis protein CheD